MFNPVAIRMLRKGLGRDEHGEPIQDLQRSRPMRVLHSLRYRKRTNVAQICIDSRLDRKFVKFVLNQLRLAGIATRMDADIWQLT